MDQTSIPWRAKIGLVVVGYAGVLVVSALWVIRRYLAGLRDPDMFSGGMGAGGDWMLELIIVAMLFAPTLLLALFIRDSEEASTKFAKVLLGFGLTAPLGMGLMAVPAFGQTNSLIGTLALYRTFAFPMSLFGLIGCCVLAKFKRPRRLILYSLIIEIMTFVLLFTLLSKLK